MANVYLETFRKISHFLKMTIIYQSCKKYGVINKKICFYNNYLRFPKKMVPGSAPSITSTAPPLGWIWNFSGTIPVLIVCSARMTVFAFSCFLFVFSSSACNLFPTESDCLGKKHNWSHKQCYPVKKTMKYYTSRFRNLGG